MGSRALEVAVDQGSSSDGEEVNILLVDDQAVNLRYLNAVLSNANYKVFFASSGSAALELAAQHEFALILLDVTMPGMDGFEVASRLGELAAGRTTPIMFVTASGDNVEWVFRAYSLGAVDFLNKPLNPHVVRGKVAVFAELYRQQLRVRQQALALRETERRERELELERVKVEHERRIRHLAESQPNVIWIADPEGRFEYVNRRWSDVTGLPAQAAEGLGWLNAVHPADRPSIVERWREASLSGRDLEIECRLQAPAGEPLWYLCRALPERDHGHAIVRWFGSFTNVHQQKQAQEQSEIAIGLRDEFISIASHELRTPLTALRLQLDQLVKDNNSRSLGDPRSQAAVGAIDRQVNRLTLLIDNLLDVSRITSGHLVLNRETYDLVEAVTRLVEDFAAPAAGAGCHLSLSAEPSICGRWDRVRLDQAVGNLIANAIKYAPAKPIELGVHREGDQVLISVSDRGIGIDSRHMARIFERFERAVPARNYGGLGLGLWLSRQIAQAHGGTIEVSSQVGEGSTFLLSLPLLPQQALPGHRDGSTSA
jgi:PAS domain S-box-containing protein